MPSASGLHHEGAITNVIDPGLQWIFYHNLYRNRDMFFTKIFKILGSTLYQEKGHGIGDLQMAEEKPEGNDVDFVTANMLYQSTYTHTTFGQGIKISEELLDDERFGLMAQLAMGLADSLVYRIETDAGNVINNAHSGSYLGPDSKSLAATDHPRDGGTQTWSNLAGTPAALSYDSTSDLILLIRKQVTDKGAPCNFFGPYDFHCHVDNSLEAEQLFGSAFVPSTTASVSAVNVIRSKISSIVASPYYSRSQAYHIVDPKHSMKMFWRKLVQTQGVWDIVAGIYKLVAKMRYSMGWDEGRGLAFQYGA